MKVKRPCGHYVLVQLKKLEEKTAGGIYLPTANDMRHKVAVEEATVLQLGPNAYKAFDGGEPWVQPGDLVGIKKYSGVDYHDGDVIYRVVLDSDIVAVLENTEGV